MHDLPARDPHAPLAVFAAVVDALNAGDWMGVARRCDPVSLRAFHRALLERQAFDDPQHESTAEQELQAEPEMPRAATEYRHLRAHDLVGLPSLEALRALAPEAAFARWLEFHSVGAQLTRATRDAGLSPDEAADFRASLVPRPYRHTAVGALADGAHVVHVLYHAGVSWPFVEGWGDAEPTDDDETADDETADDDAWPARWLASRPADEQALAQLLSEVGHPSIATGRWQPDGSWRLLVDELFLHIGSLSLDFALDRAADARPATDTDAD